MNIRPLIQTDIPAFYRMLTALDSQTRFMMFEPGERPVGEEACRQMEERLKSSNSLILAAFDVDDTAVAGFISAEKGHFRRTSHCAYIAVGILEEYRNQGIGSRFFQELENWAVQNGVTRLELTVMCHNENAIRLYRKAGFEMEGTSRHTMIVDGTYVDEYHMAKLLQPSS